MSKKIRFIKDHGRNKCGWVIGTTESAAAQLIALGVAVAVADDVRALKYAPTSPVQAECIAPVIEELEAAPKGAKLPIDFFEVKEVQQHDDTETITAKK
ncbi:MAG: hypothetical protein IPK73_30840 [Candidatus Obscuribacter sp.]|nr:hypothetical protein [Candidatus Obscuribacter sp.]